MKEAPRSRLAALAFLLGLPVRPHHHSRGGQVTKAFFVEVAGRLGMDAASLAGVEKTRVSSEIARYLGVHYERSSMTSRGARVSNAWFDAVIGRLIAIRMAMSAAGAPRVRSALSQERLSAHLVSDASVDHPASNGFATCYVCGDIPGERLGVEVIEAHATGPYELAGREPRGSIQSCLVCPSCHSALHRLGIQARVLRRQIRP